MTRLEFRTLAEGLLLPEVWVPCVLSIIFHQLSVITLGKWSITLQWLFSGLSMWAPTEASLKKITMVATVNASRVNSNNNTYNEILDVTETILLEPSAVVKVEHQKRQVAYLFKSLDVLGALVMACVLSVVVHHIMSIYRIVHAPCSHDGQDNMECWAWQAQESRKARFFLALLVATAFDQWWRLCMSAQHYAVNGLKRQYHLEPSSYITAFGVSLSIWSLTASIGENQVSPPRIGEFLCPNLYSQYQAAILEASVRTVLWIRWIGVTVDGTTVHYVTQLCRSLVALAGGCLAVVLAEPIRTLQQSIAYRLYIGDSVQLNEIPQQRTARGKYWKTCSDMASVTILAFFCVLVFSYTRWAPAKWSYSLRLNAVFWLVLLLFLVCRVYQQDYLRSALPLALQSVQGASSSEMDQEELAAKIKYPFRFKFTNLVPHGTRLASIPLLMIIVMALVYLCSLTRTGKGIYPVGYGGSLQFEKELLYWEKGVGLWQMEKHRNEINWFQFWSGSRVPATLFTQSTGGIVPDPLAGGIDRFLSLRPETTLIEKIKRLQSAIRKSRRKVKRASIREKLHQERSKAEEELYTILVLIASYPILTSTVLLTIVEVLSLSMATVILTSITRHLFVSRPTMLQWRDRMQQLTACRDKSS